MVPLFGALTQCEREIIRDRTGAGLAVARPRGRRGGRPAKLNPDQVRTARRVHDERELTVEEIGRSSAIAAPLYAGRWAGTGRRRRRAVSVVLLLVELSMSVVACTDVPT